MLDEPSNNLDLNALAWLENYMAETWKGTRASGGARNGSLTPTVLVVSHDRSFRASSQDFERH